VTRVQRTYDNLEASWLIGLLRKEIVTNDVAGHSSTRTQEWDYHPDGRQHHHILERGNPQYELRTTFYYDPFGNQDRTTVVDTIGGEERKTHITFDPEGVFPILKVNGLFHTERSEWDTGLGVATANIDENGVRTEIVYDGFARPIERKVLSPGGLALAPPVVTTYARVELTPIDVITRTVTSGGGDAPIESERDRVGRERRVETLGYDHQAVFSRTEFDFLGRMRRTSLPTLEGQEPEGWNELEHDHLGRVRVSRYADGTREKHRYWRLETVSIDRNGHFSRVMANDLGQLVRVKDPFVCDENECHSGIVDSTCYDHGPFGTLTKVRPCEADYNPAYDGPAPIVMEYDLYGRRTKLHDEKTGLRIDGYNPYGELVSLTDAREAVSHFGYDLLGRKITRVDDQGVTRWTWDDESIGQLSGSSSPTGHRIDYRYDDFGRITSVDRTIAGQHFRHDYTYDPTFGRLETVAYPGPSETLRFEVRYRYDALGRVLRVENAGNGDLYWSLQAADLLGRPMAELLGNGTTSAYAYYPMQGRIRQIETTNGNLVLQRLQYGWHPNGNLMWRSDAVPGNEKTEHFSYDARDRLTMAMAASGNGAKLAMASYDPYGNFTSRSDVGAYVYDAQRMMFAGQTTYTYNDNGGVETRNGDSFTTYGYTPFEKLASAQAFGQPGTTFEYDADHTRVLRVVEGGRRTVYAGGDYQREQTGVIAPA
jgi:YD repeat-containing protein